MTAAIDFRHTVIQHGIFQRYHNAKIPVHDEILVTRCGEQKQKKQLLVTTALTLLKIDRHFEDSTAQL